MGGVLSALSALNNRGRSRAATLRTGSAVTSLIMRHEPVRIVNSQSPTNVRRKRQTQQRSSCCCCAVVVLSLIIGIIAFRGPVLGWVGSLGGAAKKKSAHVGFPLEISTDARTYYRYSIVKITATIVDATGAPTAPEQAPLISVFRDGQVVTTVGGITKVRLRGGGQAGEYIAHWPVPWNAEPGTYTAEAALEISNPEQWSWRSESAGEADAEQAGKVGGKAWCLSRAQFEIPAVPLPEGLPPGTCIATWEQDFRATGIPSPDGKSGDWRTMLDWCEYVGADTFWFRGAVTQVHGGPMSFEEPFYTVNLEAVPKMAAEARRRGIKFGAWAVAYSTYPHRGTDINRNKPPYDYTLDISVGTGAVSEKGFISLLDERRIDHLAKFVADMEALPDVDHIGFDYFRTDSPRGGYEMTERFTSEMPVSLPSGWDGMSEKERMRYVARATGVDWQKNREFYDCWNWWRAHMGATNLRKIFDKGRPTKPTWIFVLSWEHGKQHGQDPVMFTDAGLTFVAPMLYQVDHRRMFDTMTKSWNSYLYANQVNIAPGDQVDFIWHQKMIGPTAGDKHSAVEEFYDRIVTGHRELEPGDGVTRGVFMHDISRCAISGSRGPYPGKEWATGAAAAFTEVRNNWKVYPLIVTMDNLVRTEGSAFTATVSIRSLSDKKIDGISVKLMDMPGVEIVGEQPVRTLAPKDTLVVQVNGRVTGPSPKRGNRFMVAVRVAWPDGQYGETFRRELPRHQTVMKYVQLGG